MYVNVAYCYRLRSVFCLSVTLVSPAKMAEAIEMLFGCGLRLDARNYVLHGVQIPHAKGQF